MNVAVSSVGTNLDAPVDLRFGRTQYFIIVDSETMKYEAIQNPYMAASGGAGIQAAQLIGNRGVQAVISGVLGPNAYQTLRTIGVPMYQTSGGSVREVIEAFNSGQLNQIEQPGPAHAGMGGRGMGMGAGMGRKGKRMRGGQGYQPSSISYSQSTSNGTSKTNEIDKLKKQATALNSQLEDIMERIKQLEQKSEN